jgi:hypothetical protein
MKKLQLAKNLALPADEAITVTESDLHWAAGLFEGEGTVTIAVRNRDETYRIVVSIANTDRQVIDWFQSRWPGYVQGAYGKRPRRKPAWYWTLIGPRAEAFIRQLRPFLRTERVRRKVELAIAFRDHQHSTGHKGGPAVPIDYKSTQRRMYQEMRSLNARGVAA